MSWVAAGVAAGAVGGALISSNSASKAADKQAAATGQAVGETQRQYDQSRADLAPYREAGNAALSRLRTLLGIEDAPENEWLRANVEPQIRAHMASIGQPLPADWKPDAASLAEWKRAYFPNGVPSEISAPTADSGSLLRKFSTEDLNADPVYKSGLEFGLDEGTKAIERRAAAGGGYDSGATLKGLTRFATDYGSTKAGESYGRFTNDQDRTYGKLSGVAGMGSGATSVGVNANANEATNLSNLYTGGANAQGAATIAGGNAASSALNNIGQYAMLRQLTGGGQRTTTPAPVDMSRLGE